MPGIGRLAALLYVLTAALVAADTVLTGDSSELVAVADRQEEEASQFGAVIPVTYRQLPAGTGYKRVTVGVEGAVGIGESDADGAFAGVEETLIYSNTRGRTIIPLPAVFLVADDIATIAPDGCRITRFSFQVMGNVSHRASENRPYTVTYALWDTCPEAVPADPIPPRIISGTFGALTVDTADADGPANIGDVVEIEVDVTELGVSGNTSMWLAITFDRDNAAIIGGAPAVEGFSGDSISFPHLGCNPNLGTFPGKPHASFNMQIYGDSLSCPTRHIQYRNTREEGIPLNVGTDQVVVDDLTLLTSSGHCLLTGYEVAAEGRAVFHVELRRGCAGDPPDLNWSPNGTSAAIAGTYKRQSIGSLSTGTRIIRIPIDPPVLISGTVFLAVKVTNPTGGPILTGTQAIVGSTGSVLQQMNSDGSCGPVNLPPGLQHGALQVTLICDGPAEVGACCDMFITECVGGANDGELCDGNFECNPPGTCESICREVPQVNCPGDPRDPHYFVPRWRGGDACDPDPFDFACGTAACCVLDDGCDNLTSNQCEEKEPVDERRLWQLGRFCGEGDQRCALGDCALARSGPGCWNEECERFVCSVDSWCCDVEWDELCVRTYERICDSPPMNDYCYGAGRQPFVFEALSVDVNSTTFISNAHARLDPALLGFSCFERTERRCVGGHFADSLCEDDSDCNIFGEGTCEDLVILPERQGVGDLWFKFTATRESALVQTCETSGPVTDTIIEVYSAEDDSSTSAACQSLVSIGCKHLASSCEDNRFLAGLCVRDLVIGKTYYVKVAGSTESDRGIIVLRVEPSCTPLGLPPRPSRRTGVDLTTLRASLPSEDYASDEDEALVLGETKGFQWDQGEVPYDPPVAKPIDRPAGVVSQGGSVERDGFVSVQVNVDAFGNNIVGDAANEPSIAVDPSDPNRIVIGWRQFDTVASNFRQAGWGYSHDGGQTWTFPGVLEPGVFRSDPVLAAASEGIFYFYSLTGDLTYDLFTSFDGGVTWPRSVPAFGGDKGWMIADTTGGLGEGNIYAQWTGGANFARSTDGGESFTNSVGNGLRWGTLAVGVAGEVYSVSAHGSVSVSRNAWNLNQTPIFEFLGASGTGGGAVSAGPNPGGLLGQGWIAVDHSSSVARGNVYVVTTRAFGHGSRIMFARSEDRGETWQTVRRLDDDPMNEGSWQWFGTMSVAPNGRIDVIWNDTRNSGLANLGELFYANSDDGGESWSASIPVSPMFDSFLGWPNQNKLGDYYHMVSDNQGAHVAYAATFNGEQDVYYLRIGSPPDCNENGFPDGEDVAKGRSLDCDGDMFPDECERNFDGDEFIDDCDPDRDNDGIANEFDVCERTGRGVTVTDEGRPFGDTTGNCDLDLSDYWRFRNCMVDGQPGLPAQPDACRATFDYDRDRQFTLRDFAVFQNGFQASLR